MQPEMAAKREPRRSFLKWLISVTGVAWVASAIYPVIRYLSPLPTRAGAGPVEVPKDKLAAVQGKQAYAVLRAAGTRILVLRDPSGKLHALSAVCTHEGCTVQYRPGEEIIWCACHNGKYTIDGKVISGPPPRPLPRFQIVRDAQGNVMVQLQKA